MNSHVERSSPQTAGDLNITNYTILNTFKLHARRIWLFAACCETLNPLIVVNLMRTKIQSKTWTLFPSSNTLQSSQTWNLNHHHLLCRGRKHTPALALCWVIKLSSHGNATLRVALRRTYRTIPTTRLGRVKCINISSVESRRRVCWHTMTMCWRKKTQLCVSQASKTGMTSRRSWLSCQMIRLLGSGNYTLSRRWDGMTITNARSNTGVKTLSKPWDGWCGSQPTPSISFTPFSVTLTAIRHWNSSILKCTLQTGGGRHRLAVILEDNNVLIEVKAMLGLGDTRVPLIFMSNGHISQIVLATRHCGLYIWQLAIYLRRSASCPQRTLS